MCRSARLRGRRRVRLRQRAFLATLQQRQQVLERHRPAEQVALQFVATARVQPVALLFGLTSHDASFGFTGGFTYVFDAFQVP